MAYLSKRTLFPPQIKQKPPSSLGLAVVIPCRNEPDVLQSLQALENCALPKCAVEVIVVLNGSEKDAVGVRNEDNEHFKQIGEWMRHKNKLQTQRQYHILYHPDLPEKHAGAGLARKIGMDEAAYRFKAVENENGVIACYDADCLCDENYLRAIWRFFRQHEHAQACSIYYEHPTAGNRYSPDVYEAIVLYELHLRYYVNALRYAGLPSAFQTVGSAMAVRCDAYQKQGGMNRRKAGEDFYFLHKFTALGGVGELNDTRVIPSPRVSTRVPFGTGKAVGQIVANSKKGYASYHPQIFEDLKCFFDEVPHLYGMSEKECMLFLAKLPPSIGAYLRRCGFAAPTA